MERQVISPDMQCNGSPQKGTIGLLGEGVVDWSLSIAINPRHMELIREQLPEADDIQIIAAYHKHDGNIVNTIMELCTIMRTSPKGYTIRS